MFTGKFGLRPMDAATAATQLRGTVRSAADSSLISNATVTAATPAGITPVVSKYTRTDANGKYRIKPLPPGIYDITVVATGFAPFTEQTVELKLGEGTKVNADMEEG